MWALRSRFIKVEITAWQRVRIVLRRTRLKLWAPFERWRNKIKARAHFETSYPFIELGDPQPGRWIADASGKRWDGHRTWRTRVGPSVVCWECGSPSYDAFNVQMPDGSRADIHKSMTGWRRRAVPPNLWTYGRLEISETDVKFVDFERQPTYVPPPLSEIPNLEAELARSADFVGALDDDRFAVTAFRMLAFREWMKIGHREFDGGFEGHGTIAEMIAGVRNKGENYLDIRNAEFEGSPSLPEHIQQMHGHLSKIGWRTHTADEMRAIFREDFRDRLRDRVDLLRQIKVLELRPPGHCEHWLAKAPYGALEMPIYDEDELTWFEDLTAEQEAARAGEVSVRLFALATNAQISRHEYNELAKKLGCKLFGLYQ